MCSNENILFLKQLIFNDKYSNLVDNAYLELLLNTQSFNAVIIMLATMQLEELSSNPTKYSETGGISVELGNTGSRIKTIIELAKKNFYSPVVPILTKTNTVSNFASGSLNAMTEYEDELN